MPREGSRRGSEHALLMNRYDCELVRDGQKWRFKRVMIDNAWIRRDPETLNALAGRQGITREIETAKIASIISAAHRMRPLVGRNHLH